MSQINWFAIAVFFLVLIHTADMELTTRYVGDNWENESFLPMSLTIKHVGIWNACWISRLIMYFYILFSMLTQEKRWSRYLFYTITILYWSAMVGWLFFLGYIKWPN